MSDNWFNGQRIQRIYWDDKAEKMVTEDIDPFDFYIQPTLWQRIKFFLKGILR